MKQLVLASGNAGKLKELSALLAPLGIEVLPQSAFNVSEAEEPHPSFIENAIAKARHASRATGLPALADDSGLCVDALGGAPGVHTARYAGEPADSERNIDKLLAALAGVEHAQRSARFVSAVCALLPDGRKVTACGTVEGYIGEARVGAGGFGYDPIFLLPCEVGFAELSEERKNAISHRGRAIRKLAFKLRHIRKMRRN